MVEPALQLGRGKRLRLSPRLLSASFAGSAPRHPRMGRMRSALTMCRGLRPRTHGSSGEPACLSKRKAPLIQAEPPLIRPIRLPMSVVLGQQLETGDSL